MPTSNGKKFAVGGLVGGVFVLAAAIIHPWEGRELQPYRDIVGVLTVCDGHTGRSTGTKIENRRYTPAECDRLLEADMRVAWSHVERCITAPMNTNQAAALLSATFNLGPRVVCGSTLQRRANANDWAAACAELSRWNRAGGREVRGLTNRRAAERKVCES